MKKISTLCCLNALLATATAAQITITNAVFPVAGDTLRTTTEVAPSGNFVTPPGGPQVWDFSNLQAGQEELTVYLPASQGVNFQNFSNATVVVQGPFSETYYRNTNTQVTNLGFAGLDQFGLGLNTVSPYYPPVVERRAPMNVFDINSIASNQSWAFSIEALPDSLLQGLGLVDSLRFRVNTDRIDVVDGFGTCTIPSGTYEVLREKRTTYISTAIDAKVPFLGWIDISQLLGGTGGGLLNNIGTDTTQAYFFVSNVAKEPIAVVNTNVEGQVRSVQFKYDDALISAAPEAKMPLAGVSLQPNPAVEQVQLAYNDLPAGDYKVQIFSVLGRELLTQTERTNTTSGVLTVNLNDLTSGTYLCRLSSADGTTVATRRLVVVQP